MGLRVTGQQSGGRWYIPEAYGNREDVRPVRVRLWTPTEAERRDLRRDLPTPVQSDPQRAESILDDEVWIAAMLERFVLEVENYERQDDAGNWVPIATAEDLHQYGHTLVMLEVMTEAMQSSSLAEAQKKTSGRFSGSTDAETPASSGVAESVEIADSTELEDAMMPELDIGTSLGGETHSLDAPAPGYEMRPPRSER